MFKQKNNETRKRRLSGDNFNDFLSPEEKKLKDLSSPGFFGNEQGSSSENEQSKPKGSLPIEVYDIDPEDNELAAIEKLAEKMSNLTLDYLGITDADVVTMSKVKAIDPAPDERSSCIPR